MAKRIRELDLFGLQDTRKGDFLLAPSQNAKDRRKEADLRLSEIPHKFLSKTLLN